MGQTYAVVAEVRDEKLRQVTLEALQAVRIMKQIGDRVVSILIGHDLTEPSVELAKFTEDQVYVMDHPSLREYTPESYMHALKQVFDQAQPTFVLLGHTSIGRDLGPQIAVHLGAGQISDVTAVEISDGVALFTRPLYAGKAFEQKRFTGNGGVITLRPNNLPPTQPAASPAPTLSMDYKLLSGDSLHTVIQDIARKAAGRIDLAEAKVVVSGGRGAKGEEGFKLLEQLAEVLGGAVGASRGACDAGYCDYALQIGQTGKVVTPELYIACGISGAIQHLAGMNQSRIIVAVNKDPEAPIFKIADYGIVGDLFEVVPLLTEQFKKVRIN